MFLSRLKTCPDTPRMPAPPGDVPSPQVAEVPMADIQRRHVATEIVNALRITAVFGFLTTLTVSPASSLKASEPDAEGIKFFETKIRPLLVEHCIDCHGADSQESELRLDTFAGMMTGGHIGPVMVPGSVDESLLISVVRYKDETLRMPPEKKLSDEEIALLTEWVAKGSPHPEKEASGSVAPRRGKIDFEEAKNYWAFRPVTRPELPQTASDPWVKNPIDAFMLDSLRSHKLNPVAPASKLTLIRRATFDLTGLPPTPEEIAEFVADNSPEAFEKVIDRLLASKEYAERWGRHWLDVARYADSNGLDENVAFTDAWRYRNYVIQSFHENKPFDRFILEQVAGDLLYEQEKMQTQPDGTRKPIDEDFNLLIATGFLSLGPKVLAEKDPVKMEMDIIDEQIDALGQSILGLTLACARCHDHKFDPLSTEDYYAVAGILKSTQTMASFKVVAKTYEHEIPTAKEREERKQRDGVIAAKQAEINEAVKAANVALAEMTGADKAAAPPKDAETKYREETKAALKKLRDELADLKAKNTPLPTAMGVKDGEATDLKVHIRGSHLTLGKVVPRGVPQVIAFNGPLTLPEKGSGRLELARWLVDPRNPLTPRVAINRIWGWHFGQAIVPTPDNFGKLGTAPTNPQLLDWLASEFIAQGWSMKAMHKLIMLSNTYQMSTAEDPANALVDVDNKLQWRANVRRLEAEAVRDSILAISGQLDRGLAANPLNIEKGKLIFDHTSKDNTGYDTFRRSVYLPVVRNNLYDVFSLFDYSAADVTTGRREVSTVAPQALFMLNSPLMLSSSEALAERLLREGATDEQRIQRLYFLCLGREPTPAEIERTLQYRAKFSQLIEAAQNTSATEQSIWSALVQSVLASNEFIYVN